MNDKIRADHQRGFCRFKSHHETQFTDGREHPITTMENITLNRVTRCDESETELELTVRGHKVTGLFPATSKPEVYRSIKSILICACISNHFIENMQKI